MNPSRIKAAQASLLLFAFALIGAGCSIMHRFGSSVDGPHVDATGPQTEDKRTVDAFDKVEVGNAFQVDVKIGSPASVTLDVPKDLLPHIKTGVSGGTLKIESDVSFSLPSSSKAKAHIVMPALAGATVSGAATMKVDGTVTGQEFSVDASGASVFECSARSDKVSIEASGASRVTVSDMAAKSLKVDASGAGTCIFSGTSDEASVEASGASTVRAAALTVKNAKVEATGGSNAAVRAEETLSAEADGGSMIHYTGSAKVTKDSSGGSEIAEGE